LKLLLGLIYWKVEKLANVKFVLNLPTIALRARLSKTLSRVFNAFDIPELVSYDWRCSSLIIVLTSRPSIWGITAANVGLDVIILYLLFS